MDRMYIEALIAGMDSLNLTTSERKFLEKIDQVMRHAEEQGDYWRPNEKQEKRLQEILNK